MGEERWGKGILVSGNWTFALSLNISPIPQNFEVVLLLREF